jgi:hypothetical protein
MKPWELRPVEEANLLNPAFCSINIAAAVSAYSKETTQPMPFSLIFLVLPLVLHKNTRVNLPKTIRTLLAPWIQKNYDLRVHFADRAISLKPYTKESIIFGCNRQLMKLETDGSVSTLFKDNYINKIAEQLDQEAAEYVKKSNFVGKWFAASGSPETIMTLLGVRP